jgi:hypothetical protein
VRALGGRRGALKARPDGDAPIEGVEPMSRWSPEDVPLTSTSSGASTTSAPSTASLSRHRPSPGPSLAKIVTDDGVGAPVVTDGPFPEAKERIVDVESPERAIEIAAKGSAAPGPGARRSSSRSRCAR